MNYKDHCAALGVPRDADLNTIKKAYRKLAREHHPNMSKASGAEARFKEVVEALLAAMGRGRRDPRQGPMPMDGRDLETTVRISLEEAHRGRAVHLSLDDGGHERTLEVTSATRHALGPQAAAARAWPGQRAQSSGRPVRRGADRRARHPHRARTRAV